MKIDTLLPKLLQK